MAEYGFVYVLSNPAMPDLYKVGATRRSPRRRAEELSVSSGVPQRFAVEMYVKVPDPFAVEAAAHKLLARIRTSAGREFFRSRDIFTITNAIFDASGFSETEDYWSDRLLNMRSTRKQAAIKAQLNKLSMEAAY